MTLPENLASLLLKNSISPLPLHKTLALQEALDQNEDGAFGRYEKLALAKSLVTEIGNLHFGPEVGVGAGKSDAAVVSVWLKNVQRIANDLADCGSGLAPLL